MHDGAGRILRGDCMVVVDSALSALCWQMESGLDESMHKLSTGGQRQGPRIGSIFRVLRLTWPCEQTPNRCLVPQCQFRSTLRTRPTLGEQARAKGRPATSVASGREGIVGLTEELQQFCVQRSCYRLIDPKRFAEFTCASIGHVVTQTSRGKPVCHFEVGSRDYLYSGEMMVLQCFNDTLGNEHISR